MDVMMMLLAACGIHIINLCPSPTSRVWFSDVSVGSGCSGLLLNSVAQSLQALESVLWLKNLLKTLFYNFYR